METFFELLQDYWVETISAVALALLGIFRKWIAKLITSFFVWVKAMCPGKSIMKRLDEIQAELKPNHGASIKDALNRIETKLTVMHSRINIIQAAHDIMADTLNVCRFAMDENGIINFINRPLKKLLGITDDEQWLRGSWINLVVEEDREKIQKARAQAIKNKVGYHIDFRVRNQITGDIIKVTTHTKTIINNGSGISGWTGILVVHNEGNH